MKLLKIRVRADEKGQMIYPPGFLGIPCLEFIYCDELKAGICWLVALIDDKDLAKLTDQTDIEQLSVIDAETFTSAYDPHNTEVSDETMIRAIEIKTQAGINLSATDLKALDPSDPTPGIQYRVRFIDKVKTRMGIK